MGHRSVALWLSLAACRSIAGISDEEFRSRDDGGVQDVMANSDAAVPMFGPPAVITALMSSGFDGDPTLPSDMLEIFFKSDRAGGQGGQDIWRATRATIMSAWSAPAPVAELSTTDHDTAPRISADGLTMWLTRSPLAGGRQIYVSTRTTRFAAWTTPVAVAELDFNYAKIAVTNPLVGYVEYDAGAAVPARIYRTTRSTPTSAWSTPTAVMELAHSVGYTQNPWATPDQLAMVFCSDRTGSVMGSGDIWLSRRPSTAYPWGPPVNLTTVNTMHFEADPWISPDLQHLYFTDTITGNYELYEAHAL